MMISAKELGRTLEELKKFNNAHLLVTIVFNRPRVKDIGGLFIPLNNETLSPDPDSRSLRVTLGEISWTTPLYTDKEIEFEGRTFYLECDGDHLGDRLMVIPVILPVSAPNELRISV
jgi:hypothetical protein